MARSSQDEFLTSGVATLSCLPDSILARIAEATDPLSRRTFRLACRATRDAATLCCTSLTISTYNLRILQSRGHLPNFVPEVRDLTISLGDEDAPADFIRQLQRLGLVHLRRLKTLTVELSDDHYLPGSFMPTLAAVIPPSVTRLVLLHTLTMTRRSPCQAPTSTSNSAGFPHLGSTTHGPQTAFPGSGQIQEQQPTTRNATALESSASRSLHTYSIEGAEDLDLASVAAAAAAARHSVQLDLFALQYLLTCCPHIREVALEGGCWVTHGSELQALAALPRAIHPVSPGNGAGSCYPSLNGAAAIGTGSAEAANVTASGALVEDNGGGRSDLAKPEERCPPDALRMAVRTIHGLYVGAPCGYQGLPEALAALSGLRSLHLQLVPIGRCSPRRAGRQQGGGGAAAAAAAGAAFFAQPHAHAAQAGAAAAAAYGGGGAGAMGAGGHNEEDDEDEGPGDVEGLAVMDAAFLALASEKMLRGLAVAGPALAGLTRLVVCEFQGCTLSLLAALQRLPLLEHLGLSALDDSPYIKNGHLELLARLPKLRHLAVDRLDISHPPHNGMGTAAGPDYTSPYAGVMYGVSSYRMPYETAALLPGLTALEVTLVAHSEPRLPHVFPSVVRLELRWLWEQAMRKVAGWTSLQSLALANLDACLDWGLLRTLTGLTRLQLCRGSTYEQLAELLYLLRALPRLEQLRLSGWHCRTAAGTATTVAGATPQYNNQHHRQGDAERAGLNGRGGEGWQLPGADPNRNEGLVPGATGGAVSECTGGHHPEGVLGAQAGTAAALEDAVGGLTIYDIPVRPCAASTGALESEGGAGVKAAGQPGRGRGRGHAWHGVGPAGEPPPEAAAAADGGGGGVVRAGPSAAMAAAFAALDPDLHAAWGRIRTAPSAAAAAGAALSLLRALPVLNCLEIVDCGNPLLLGLSSRALLGQGGPLGGLRELHLVHLLDALAGDVEAAVEALPGLRRLVIRRCWPVDGSALLRMRALRDRGVDVTWRE